VALVVVLPPAVAIALGHEVDIIGAAARPMAVVAAPAGGTAGAMAGGHWGYGACEEAYDYVDDLLRHRWR